MESNNQLRRLTLGLILFAGALGIFVIPWFVPIRVPSTSLSWEFGFNNGVAIGATGLTLILLFLHGLVFERGRRSTGPDELIVKSFELYPMDGPSLTGITLTVAAVLGAITAGMYWCVPSQVWGEMNYFLPKLYQMILGMRPFRDFPFYYGPAMIWLPFGLYRVAHGALSIEEAYCASLILNVVGGIYLLSICVRLLIPPSRRLSVFLAFSIVFLNATLGDQYTALRFVLPVLSLLLAHYCVTHSSRFKAGAHGVGVVVAFLGPFINLEISPEMGFAVILALIAYYLTLWRTEERRFSYLAIVALAGAAAATPWRTSFMDLFSGFSAGFSVPVLPGPLILLCIGASFFFLPRLAILGLFLETPTGAACLALCIISGLLIAPVLDRCEPMHALYYGFGLYLFALAVLSRSKMARWFKPILWAPVAVFVLAEWPMLFHFNYELKDAYTQRLWMAAHPEAKPPPPANGFVFSKVFPLEDGLDPLQAVGRVGTPLGCSTEVARFLLRHGQYQTAYTMGNWQGAPTPANAERQADGMGIYNKILVRKSVFNPAPDPMRPYKVRRGLMALLIFPAWIMPRRPQFNPEGPVRERITRDFKIVGEFQDMYIMERRSEVAD